MGRKVGNELHVETEVLGMWTIKHTEPLCLFLTAVFQFNKLLVFWVSNKVRTLERSIKSSSRVLVFLKTLPYL